MSQARVSPLYHHGCTDVYECMGCGEFLEVPWRAVLTGGRAAVKVKEDPENRLLWLELMELDHAACGRFKDVQKAEDARRYRKPIVRAPRGDDGPRGVTQQAPLAR